MIATQRHRIPWSWAIALALPSGVAMFIEQCSNIALAFTIKKYASDPALIVFLGSINVAFNFLVAPYVAWKGDHWWTRWGRRLPFFVAGWSVMAVALIATPFAPSLWLLAICIFVWQFGMDMGFTGPWMPLYYDIVPRPQRGRAVAIQRGAMMSSRIIFNLVLLSHFDQVMGMGHHHAMMAGGHGGMALRGEHLIYISAGVLSLACAIGAWFSIRETPPDDAAERRQPASNPRFFGDIFGDRRWWPLYFLAFCAVALTANLGLLQPLLITEQFGYTKGQFGRIETIAMIPEMLLVLPLVFLIADRFSRLALFRVGLAVCTLHPLMFWLFVKFVAADQIPSPAQIIAFSVFGHVARMAACITFEPLLFDLAPRDKFGTVQAGTLFVRGFFTLIVANGVGLWVKVWSAMFAETGRYDYLSGYLYLAAVGAIGCVVAGFVIRRSRLTAMSDEPDGNGRWMCCPEIADAGK